MPTGEYVGDELSLFAQADHWKRYWSSSIEHLLGPRVLDVGAGLGGTAALFRQRSFQRWLALEPDPRLAAGITARAGRDELPAGTEVVAGSIVDLHASDVFDTILYIDVLEHIADDAGELARAARHLAPGGHLVVLAPAHAALFSPFDRHVGHFRRYGPRALRRLRPRGCSEVDVFQLDSVGLLLSLANRMLLRQSLPTPRQIAVWDRWVIPCSRVLDRLLGRRLGKTIVLVLRREA